MMALDAAYVCPHCKKGFMKEKTLFVHVCEQKRRSLARTDRHVVLGYDTYIRWYKKNVQGSRDQTYDDFAKSSYYNGFVKFGSFVSNVSPLYPDRFIDYVVTSGVPLDKWCSDTLYDSYVIDLVRVETVETALERTIKYMIEWGDANSAAWNHYFLYVNANRAAYDIKDGKISPWVVLNSASGKALLKKFNDDQLNAITHVIDPPFWVSKFKKLPADVELVREVVRESNI